MQGTLAQLVGEKVRVKEGVELALRRCAARRLHAVSPRERFWRVALARARGLPVLEGDMLSVSEAAGDTPGGAGAADGRGWRH